MDVKQFENNRWTNEDQKLCFRHRAALDLVRSGTVLDLGCGDGLLLSLFKEKGVSGAGLDISEKGVAKAKAKGLDVMVCDFSAKIPFADRSFDNVVILDVLEHVYDPKSLLAEAARVSRVAVVAGVPNFNSLPARIQTLLGRVPENNLPKKGHIYWFNYPVLVSMLRDTGLRLDRVESNTMFERIPVLGSVMRLLARLMPNLFALSFVVRASRIA
jgi:methionine biosynthesis protein MetW